MFEARGLRWWVLGAAIGSVAAPSLARACSCSPSGPGRFYVGEAGRLPRDATGIPHFRYVGRAGSEDDLAKASPERVTLLRREGASDVRVGFTIVRRGAIELIVPERGLRPGDVYTVRVRAPDHEYEWQKQNLAEGREGQPEVVSAVVVQDEALPLSEARVELTERRKQPVNVAAGGGQCYDTIKGDVRELKVVLPAALAPYREYLQYETLVDGRPWLHAPSMCSFLDAGRTWTKEAGTDRLFTACEGKAKGLAAGVHTVAVRLSSPDGAAVFVTPEVKFELDCRTDPPPPPVAPVAPVVATGSSCACTVVAGPPLWIVLLLVRRRRPVA